jgi:hypothetical protein
MQGSFLNEKLKNCLVESCLSHVVTVCDEWKETLVEQNLPANDAAMVGFFLKFAANYS